jgi:hypothetical protein
MPARAIPKLLCRAGRVRAKPYCRTGQNHVRFAPEPKMLPNHSYRNCRRIGSPEAQDKASCGLKLAHLRAGA